MPTKKTSPRKASKQVRTISAGCSFCKEGKNPNYKDYQILEKFLTDRAKIVGRKRTGVCSKHQRKLSRAVKRARHLGLLPFTPHL